MSFPFSICIPETEILSFLRGAFPDHKERVRLRQYDMCENARRTLTTMIIWTFFYHSLLLNMRKSQLKYQYLK